MQPLYFLRAACSILPPVANGNVIPTSVLTSSSSFGTVVQYSCFDGYFPSSDVLESVCMQLTSGPTWSLGDGPICSRGMFDQIMQNSNRGGSSIKRT